MSFSKSDLDHVIALSHLSVADDVKPVYLDQIGRILDHLAVLESFDLTAVPPSQGVTQGETPLRPDEITLRQSLLLEKNAPAFDDHCFVVPKILTD